MRTGTHARDDGSFGRSASSQTLKGAGLIALAVVIGAFLLHTAPRTTTAVTTTPRSAGTNAPKGSHGSGSSATTTSTTVAPAHAANQVSVLVANGTSVGGLGGKVRGELNAAGYNTSKPAVNASSPASSTAIYFEPGYEADALNVANTLSLAAGNVFAMPSPTPVPASALAGVNVVVIAGSDIGGSSSSNTTEAPAGNTIAPSPTEASSGSSTTIHHSTTTTSAHSTSTTVHSSTSTTAHTTTTG
jgi:hypothetical protein